MTKMEGRLPNRQLAHMATRRTTQCHSFDMPKEKVAGVVAVVIGVLAIRVAAGDLDADWSTYASFGVVVLAAFGFIVWHERRLKNRARPPKPYQPFAKRKS